LGIPHRNATANAVSIEAGRDVHRRGLLLARVFGQSGGSRKLGLDVAEVRDAGEAGGEDRRGVPVGFGVPGEAPSEDGFDGEVEAAVAGAHRPDADPVVVLRAEAIDLTTSPTGRRALRVGPVAAGSHDAEWGQLHGPHPGWSSGQVGRGAPRPGAPRGRGPRGGGGGNTPPTA
jgi:hypothetical protein